MRAFWAIAQLGASKISRKVARVSRQKVRMVGGLKFVSQYGLKIARHAHKKAKAASF
jgi:hypothetical protein